MRRAGAAIANQLLAVVLAFATMLIMAALLDEELAPAPATLAALAVALLTGCVAWNLGSARTALSSPSTLYAAALAVFHLGLVVPWVAGLAEPPAWLAAAPEAALSRALLCVLLALCCLQGGLLVGWRRRRRNEVTGPSSSLAFRRVYRGSSALHSGSVFVAAVAAGAALVNILSIGVERVLSTSYGLDLYALTDSRVLQTGCFWLLPAAVLVACASAREGAETRRALTLASGVLILLLWTGNRGGAISFFAAALVVWSYTRGPLPPRVVLPVFLGLLLVIPMVGALRQLPRNGIDLAGLEEAATAASPLAAVTEMGASLRPLVETLRLVPAESSYRYGGSYLAAALRVIPNIGLTKADLDWTDPAMLPPNHWITYTVAPWTYASFGGIGFSAIAEPYLNFGLAGITGYFFLLGFALARVERTLARSFSRRNLALAAVVFMPLLLTARNDFHVFVRSAVWGVCLVLLLERIHGAPGTTRRAPNPLRRAERLGHVSPGVRERCPTARPVAQPS